MKKLQRSRKSRIIAGVCGGLGEYFGIDSIIFRLIFLLTSGLGGIYLILWIFLPDNQSQAPVKSISLTRILLLLILIPAGIFFLVFIFSFVQAFFGTK